MGQGLLESAARRSPGKGPRGTDGCQYDHVDRHGVEVLITGQDIARVDHDREKIIFTLTNLIRESSQKDICLSSVSPGLRKSAWISRQTI